MKNTLEDYLRLFDDDELEVLDFSAIWNAALDAALNYLIEQGYIDGNYIHAVSADMEKIRAPIKDVP